MNETMERLDGQRDTWMMKGQMSGWTDGRVSGWFDRWMKRCFDK